MRLIFVTLLFTTLSFPGFANLPGRESSRIDTLTTREEGEWRAALSDNPEVRHHMRRATDPEEYLRQEIALRTFLIREHPLLCPSGERAEIMRNAKDAAISRTYRKELLSKGVHVTGDDARKIFEEHRQGWKHSPAVTASEIFLWAPTDLPRLRAQKEALITKLHDRCTTLESFQEAARKYSEATARAHRRRIRSRHRLRIKDELRSPQGDP